jgi:hypothetical protein
MNLADPREIQRTHPDRILYDPTGGQPRSWDDPEFHWLNEHILVQETADGDLFAVWTSERLQSHSLRVAFSRSSDGGRTWTLAQYLGGTGLGDGRPAAWQVPVIAPTGRVYVFLTLGAGGLRCRYSDDHGRTWSPAVDLPFQRGAIDSPDPSVPPHWICPTVPLHDAQGRALIPYTHWAENRAVPGGDVSFKERHSQIELLRIDNLADNPAPEELQFTWLNQDNPVTAPHARIEGASFAQEPYLARLPDGRLFMVLRTNWGQPWYTVSADEGVSWRQAEPMRYQDGGEALKQPVSPCPVFGLQRGDYLFLYQNNDGRVPGAEDLWDPTTRNRRPSYLARGEFRPGAHQPIWWSQPRLFIDNDEIPWGPGVKPGWGRLESAAYPSLTEQRGERILWYPDRKGFLLGKLISDDLLSDLHVPA